ncbi:hypothetical protein Tco_0802296 [Tanacetum coccineum]|uniref:Aspartic peptidase DDI1-type domain-containing protein n=1 Tax=Tanacetum coccineum TaxID=301880 RepID=A0ABQ5A2M4_9ASTR
MYDVILKKKLARKKEREGNFVIACSIGELKYMNALADQGSDVNIMPLTIYNKLTSEKPIGTNLKLSLANHSYVYLVGIAKDVLVDVADIRCTKGSMTLRAGKLKVRFIRTLRFPRKVKERKTNDLDPMIPTNYMNRRILNEKKELKIAKMMK